MSATINTQAIKFLNENETPFNEKIICGCDAQEDWAYVFTDGDTIDFQIDANCVEAENTILNGGFEEGSSATSITNWTRTVDNVEQLNVTRVLDTSAPCGTYLLKFENELPDVDIVASVSQTQTITLNKSYKIKLKLKAVVGPGGNLANIFEIIVGGVSYYITPTTSWAEYEIIVNVTSAPSNNLIVLKINEVPTDLAELYVDCVEMSEYLECCLYDRVNNGCFELGQNQTESVLPTADNWAGYCEDNEGIDGSRCGFLPGIADELTQENVFGIGRNIIKFSARGIYEPSTIGVYSMPSNTLLGSVTVSLDWQEYYLDINTTDTDIKFVSLTDEPMYIDCVSVSNLQEVKVTIVSEDSVTLVNDSCVTVFDNYINVSIPIDDYEFPSCFKICVEYCEGNLFLNSNFSLGSGNLFTYWTLTQPTRSNNDKYSQNITNANWTKTAVTVSTTEIAPDGTNTAFLMNDNSAVSFLFFSQTVSYVASTNYTRSYYIKKSLTPLTYWSGIDITSGANIVRVIVNNYNGTYTSSTSGTATLFGVKIISEGDYYRVCITYRFSSGTSSIYYVYPAISTNGTTTNAAAQGSNTFWGFQNELGDFATPYIATTNATVTTSLGEFLGSNTTGVNGGRCLRMWVDTNVTNTELSQNVSFVAGTQYTIRFYAKLDAVYGNDFVNVNGTTIALTSTSWEQKEFTFTQGSTGIFSVPMRYLNDENYGFVSIDEFEIFETGSLLPICSEDMKYTEELDGCLKELVWYDSEDVALGINYASGFKNKVRVKAQLQNPNYIKEDFVKSLNGKTSFINSSKVRKTQELSIDAIPEFLWDRISQCVAISNIEYDGQELTPSIDSEIAINYDKNTLLYSGNVTLSPKGEYIISRTYNCK